MNTFLNHNGELIQAAHFSLPENAVGILETMLWENGRIALWPYHARRWRHACERLKYSTERLSDALLLHAIRETVYRNDHVPEARIRMRIFPDSGALHFNIETFPFRPETHSFKTGFTQQVTASTSAHSGIKMFPRTVYDMALQEAYQKQWDDGFLLNEYGRVAESSIANLFYLKNDTIYTPPLTEGCVNGVFRQFFMEHHRVIEQAVTPDELLSADAVFLTNALRGKIRVASIGAHHFPQ